jgi:transposase-like protein
MRSRKFYSKEYKQAKVQDWIASGKRVKAWCLENSIHYTTFLGWRKKIESSEKTNSFEKSNFIELKSQTSSQTGVFLEYAGIRIHLADDFDAVTLKRCLSVLRGGLC